MRKRILSLALLILVVLSTLTIRVAATEGAGGEKLISAYIQNGQLYAFLQLPQDSADQLPKVQITVNNAPMAEQVALEKRPESSKTHYLILADTAKTMPKHEGMSRILTSLSDAILADAPQNVTFTLAGAGSTFTVLASGISSSEQLYDALTKLPRDQEGVDLCSNVSAGIAYLRALDRTPGERVHLILITDGKRVEEKSNTELLEKLIQHSPEVIVHAVSIYDWNSDTLEAISAGTGLLMKADGRNSGGEAGKKMAEFERSLFTLQTKVPVSGQMDNVNIQLTLSNADGVTSIINLPAVPNLDNKPVTGIEPIETQPAESQPVETLPVETQPVEPVEGTQPPLTESVPGSTGPEESEPEGTCPTTAGTDDTPGEDDAWKDKTSLWFWLALGGVLLIGAIAAFTLLNKKGRMDAAVGSGIPMQLQVVSGKCRSRSKTLVLHQELIIGSGLSCDIICKDSVVAERNCRIFLKDGLIWIEDLNDKSNTSIEGIKIYAPNRIRSEDTISVGSVQFKLLF